MGIKKQEFYEGAALHLLARTGKLLAVKYESPFFLFNSRIYALLKYSTRIRSPWGFTFTPQEQALLKEVSADHEVVVAMVCGNDGVAALNYETLSTIARQRDSALHVACYRDHWEHYEISGPDGVASRKIAPSNWSHILD